MKTKKLTLISLTLLASLLIGAIAITMLSAPKQLKLKVKWTPRVYELGPSAPDPWNAEVYFAPPRPVEDINASTILLEGKYTNKSAVYLSPIRPRLIIPFDGNDVLTALLLKGGHLTPGEYRIYLEITGELNDGTPFSGEGGINLVIPDNSPP